MEFIDNGLDELNKNLQKYIFNKKRLENKTSNNNDIVEHADAAPPPAESTSSGGGGGVSYMSLSSCCSVLSCVLQILGILYIVNYMSNKKHSGGYLTLHD